MCGRYTLSTPGEEIGEVFGLEERLEIPPRFNIAPSQEAPVVRATPAGRCLAHYRWGLVPHWADDPAAGPRSINARSETVAEKRAFRDSFRRRRCLVVGDGFYEWKRVGDAKQPYYFSLTSGDPFAMAGLWDRWERGETRLESFAVLTTAANREVAAVHHRMPLILPPESWPVWLDCGASSADAARALLEPAPDGLLASHPVSTYVNSPAHDDPRCVERIDPSGGAEAAPRLF